MPRKESEPLVRVHLWLYEADWEWIKETFGGKIGESRATRAMLRKYITMVKEAANETASSTESLTDEQLADLDLKPDTGSTDPAPDQGRGVGPTD